MESISWHFLLGGEGCQNCPRDGHEDCVGAQARAPAEKGLLPSLLLQRVLWLEYISFNFLCVQSVLLEVSFAPVLKLPVFFALQFLSRHIFQHN